MILPCARCRRALKQKGDTAYADMIKPCARGFDWAAEAPGTLPFAKLSVKYVELRGGQSRRRVFEVRSRAT